MKELSAAEAAVAAHKAAIDERNAVQFLKEATLVAITKAYADGVALVLVNVADKTVEAK